MFYDRLVKRYYVEGENISKIEPAILKLQNAHLLRFICVGLCIKFVEIATLKGKWNQLNNSSYVTPYIGVTPYIHIKEI